MAASTAESGVTSDPGLALSAALGGLLRTTAIKDHVNNRIRYGGRPVDTAADDEVNVYKPQLVDDGVLIDY